MANVHLTFKKVERITTTFATATSYSTFICSTEDSKDVPVAITKNMLNGIVGINEKLLDDLIGSTLIVQDSDYTNPKTGVTTHTLGEDRVNNAVNQVKGSSMIYINPTNGTVVKSEGLSELIRESADNIDAKVIVSREKDARLDKLKKAQELAASLLPPIPAQRVVEKLEAVDEEEVPF
jgi:hypothetical protein